MSLKSCDQSLLAVRHMRLKTEGDRALAAVELWNSLPLSLRSADFMASFEKTDKNKSSFFSLFRQFFYALMKHFVMFILTSVITIFSLLCYIFILILYLKTL